MVIARTDLYVPDIGARSRRWWRRIAAAQPTRQPRGEGTCSLGAAAVFTSVFAGRGEIDRTRAGRTRCAGRTSSKAPR